MTAYIILILVGAWLMYAGYPTFFEAMNFPETASVIGLRISSIMMAEFGTVLFLVGIGGIVYEIKFKEEKKENE